MMPARPPFVGAFVPQEQRTCVRHGEFTSWQRVDTDQKPYWTVCPRCNAEREQQDDWHFESGLQGRFLEATFDTFEAVTAKQRKALAECQQFVATLAKNTWRPLLLIGPPGTGKTHLGAAIVHGVIYQRRMPAQMHSARRIVRNIRATWAKGAAKSEDDVIRDLARTCLLVIDEVGVGFGSESEATHLLDVIDQRYQLNRPTVLISNLNLPQVEAALGDRAYDRCRENSLVLACDWPSRRRAGIAHQEPQ